MLLLLSSNGTLGCSLGCCKAGSAEEQQELSLGKKGLPVGIINIYVGVARLFFFFEAVVGVIFAMYRQPHIHKDGSSKNMSADCRRLGVPTLYRPRSLQQCS